jgi:trehalose utilization protein
MRLQFARPISGVTTYWLMTSKSVNQSGLKYHNGAGTSFEKARTGHYSYQPLYHAADVPLDDDDAKWPASRLAQHSKAFQPS